MARLAELIVFCKTAEGKTVAVAVGAAPGGDVGAEEVEVAGVDAGVGIA